MPTERIALKQFLVVVRHAYHVELYHIIDLVDPCWVDISMDNAVLMDVLDRLHQLSENAQDLDCRERSLAEGLPVLHVVWCLLYEGQHRLLPTGCVQEDMASVEAE